jgi:hypothetical protein
MISDRNMKIGNYILFFSIFVQTWVMSATYYVNDNSTVNDIYCSAVGNNANPGTSAAPFATLTYVVNTIGLLPNDIVYVDAGTYYQTDENLTFNVNDITIIGAGYDYTIFDHDFGGGDSERWGNITADGFSLSGVYITGYDYGVGGACAVQISGAANVTFTNVMVNENDPGGGSSAIVIDGGSSVDFVGGGSSCNPGQASIAGGGVNVEGNGNTVSFSNYNFSTNSKDAQGGSGLYVSGDNTTSVTVANSKFEGNENGSAEGGGAVFVSGSNLTITGSCFTENFASYTFGPVYGGAICVARGATLDISDCTFSGNYAETSGKGGAIGINTSFAGAGTTATVNLTTCSFILNVAGEAADLYARVGSSNPAIYNVDDCTFSGTGLDIRDDNSAQINIQNSGSPNATGSGINLISTTASTGTPSTSCPIAPAPCFSVLPVEIIAIALECNDGKMQLSWSTLSEVNNDYFQIEGGTSDNDFSPIAWVDGIGTTTQRQDYTLNLNDNQWRGYNYVRLLQFDTDGESTSQGVLSLERCASKEELVGSFNRELNRIILNRNLDRVNLKLVNSIGEIVDNPSILNYQSEVQLTKNFPSGVYFLIIDENGLKDTVKILIN